MLYLDTSFLAPLFKPEKHSADVDAFSNRRSSRDLTVSHWTRVEFSSLVARDVRIGNFTPVQAVAADTAFEIFIEQFCSVGPVSNRDFDTAKRLLADHRSGLRAGDALHLAIASNNTAQGIYSLDKTMIAVGRSIGLSMNPGFPTADA